ncbi:oligosaccharide flippase family protein [Hydrogenophaga sp.]
MTSSVDQAPASAAEPQSFGGRARSGTIWILAGFGLGQLLRLGANVALAAILFEEVFALMAIVTAVMMGLAMFSDIGLQANVVQHPQGGEPDFLNTAWTLQVIRGVCLFLVALSLAWPLSLFYGANDPTAYQLLYLIPIAALTPLIDGFRSAKLMMAARQLRIKEATKIEFFVGPFNVVVMLVLAWYFRSAYALAVASVLSSVLFTVLSYRLLDGPPSRFHWDKRVVQTILQFGKWVFLSTLFTFLAMQIDRLALARIFTLTEVGVYSIAASLAVIVPTLAGKLQWSVLFPWYSRMLEEGMPLPEAFARTREAMVISSSYLCALLFAGAASFFELAYDERYAMGGVLLPILVCGAWFSCFDTMYGATFVASGRPKWSAMTNASKVITFGLLLAVVAILDLDIVVAASILTLSEILRWMVCQALGRRLGLRNTRSELGAFAFFVSVSVAGWWLVERAPLVSDLSPFWRLFVLGVSVTLLFAPLFVKSVAPLVRRRG